MWQIFDNPMVRYTHTSMHKQRHIELHRNVTEGVCVCVQDWKEKYIHENYSRIFEEKGHIVEQVRDSFLQGAVEGELLAHPIAALVLLSPVRTSTGSRPSPRRCVTTWWRPWSITETGPRGQTRSVMVFDVFFQVFSYR